MMKEFKPRRGYVCSRGGAHEWQFYGSNIECFKCFECLNQDCMCYDDDSWTCWSCEFFGDYQYVDLEVFGGNQGGPLGLTYPCTIRVDRYWYQDVDHALTRNGSPVYAVKL